MRWLAIIAFVLIAAGTYHQFYSPRMALKHEAEAALQGFSKAVATKDRAKINAALQALLADKIQIQLEVDFFSLGQAGSKSAVQNFDKQTFVTFIDNILYSLADYGYEAQLQDFSLSTDHQSADITFISQEWAEGTSYDAGIGITMHFTSNTTCTGHVRFDAEKPQLDKAACVMQLHAAPKAK